MKKYLLTFTALITASTAYALDCATPPTCAELGYTDTVANCIDAIKCPFDLTLGKCINTATIGQIGYFPYMPTNSGWLRCNGRFYHKNAYPDLYAKIGVTFGGGGDIFRVPDYRGDFVRVQGGNSSPIYSRQPEGLPNISGHFGMNSKTLGDEVLFTKVTMTSNYEGIGNGDMTKSAIKFDASKYNPIYGNSTNVTPVNTAVYAYIYAGKLNSSAASSSSNISSCASGSYYYTDGTCSTTRNTSKSLKGIVDSISTSEKYVKYIYGGGSSSSYGYNLALSGCRTKSMEAGIYAPYSAATKISAAGLTTNDAPVYVPSTSKKYWASSGTVYSCSSTTSCLTSSSPTKGTSYYYYCYDTDYFN